MPTFQNVRGMRDLLSEDAQVLTLVVAKARGVAELFGFSEVITPVVESYELLSAKSGEEIRQRMFTFKDLGDRTVALRPEFTASIARLITTSLKNEPKPLRLFSVGSVYRYDEPQRGRYREFWQSNFELMGSSQPEADAETILLTDSLMKAVGLQDYVFKLGHVGILRGILTQEKIDERTQNAILQKMDKKEYDAALDLVNSEKCKTILRELMKMKSSDIFKTAEAVRGLMKSEGYEKSMEAADNLIEILKLATEGGCKIEVVDPAFARGLEYYTGMIFEVYVPELEIALGGGGRYDRLIEAFGGEPTPAVGVAQGIDRIALAGQSQGSVAAPQARKRVVVIPVSPTLKGEATKIARMLRDEGVSSEFEIMGRKMAKALEDADRRKLDFAVIVGEREAKLGAVVLRNLAKREQEVVKMNEIVGKLKK
jgi:histidyl-tRNA synthetase